MRTVLFNGVLIAVSALSSLGCVDQPQRKPPPERDLRGFEVEVRADSASAASKIRSVLGLEPPLRVPSVDKYLDGGTIGGEFVDARGETLGFSFSRQMDDPEPGYLYLGRKYYRDPGAVRVGPGSDEEKAVTAGLILYGSDQVVTRLLRETLIGRRQGMYDGRGEEPTAN
ncbi:MAG: hypothetical protein R3E97_01665 [Candidatus Eisenbacteria bacterium]